MRYIIATFHWRPTQRILSSPQHLYRLCNSTQPHNLWLYRGKGTEREAETHFQLEFGALSFTPLSLAIRTSEHGETTPFPNPSKSFTCLQSDYTAPSCLRSCIVGSRITDCTRQNFKNPKGPKCASQTVERERSIIIRTCTCSSYSARRTNVCLLISYSFDRIPMKTIHRVTHIAFFFFFF